MKRILIPLAALMVSSCIIDPLYIQMPETYWSYDAETSSGHVEARVIFEDDVHASVLQIVEDSGTSQSQHGTYTTDGHRVILSGEGWSNNIQFVRTFSHLKNNSTNRNMTPIKPASHESLAGSVWVSIVNTDMHIALYDENGKCTQATYNNVLRREGIPYGWEWRRCNYTLSGNQLSADGKSATLFDDFMVIDTLAALRAVPESKDNGTNALKGTFWSTTLTSGSHIFPGVMVFNSSNTFVRVIAASELVYQVKSGTYTTDGESITFKLDDIEETCPLSGNRFTHYELDYVLEATPQSLP